MPSILLTGAATGLGAEFVKAYSSKSSNRIFALDMKPLGDVAENVSQIHGDIKSPETLEALKSRLDGVPIDLVIYSVGVRGLVRAVENAHPQDVSKAETLEVMDAATVSDTFNINALATFSIIKAVLPNLHKSYLKNNEVAPKVVIMTSRMGSMESNTSGGGYAYRASKAALNAIVRSFSIDVPYATFLLVHPGRVETGLTKCREEGAIEPEESVSSMLKLIDFVGKAHSGKFVDRFGVEIPW
ncbi:MAG: hypothetical protein M1821_004976 [Bathelium mastoideum]|nr:MAG: hypothetical protein M1821_004976 [Bathelium mastoideum]